MPPAAIDPQFIELRALVQPLSEYTSMSGVVVIVPDEVTFWETVTAAIVRVVREKAAMVRTMINIFGDLIIPTVCPPCF